MKKLFYFLCVVCMCVSLTSCVDAKDNEAVTYGKVVVNGTPATKAEIADLVEHGQHLEIRYGKYFDTNHGDFQYMYINGHRFIKWEFRNAGLDGFASIFEDGECPKCKKQREEFKRELLEEIKNIHRHF